MRAEEAAQQAIEHKQWSSKGCLSCSLFTHFACQTTNCISRQTFQGLRGKHDGEWVYLAKFSDKLMHICDNIFNSNHATCHICWQKPSLLLPLLLSAIENQAEAHLLHHLLVLLLCTHHHDPHPPLVRCLSLAKAQNSHLCSGKCATIRSSVNNAQSELQTYPGLELRLELGQLKVELRREWAGEWGLVAELGVAGVKMTKHLHARVIFCHFLQQVAVGASRPHNSCRPAPASCIVFVARAPSLSVYRCVCVNVYASAQVAARELHQQQLWPGLFLSSVAAPRTSTVACYGGAPPSTVLCNVLPLPQRDNKSGVNQFAILSYECAFQR